VPMQAVRGRASFLGPRSIGHMDPGARSTWLMIETAVDVLEGTQVATDATKGQTVSR
jgi:phosphoenolpyruvate---glycerone phosphotransferase subunit DhaL